MSEESSKPAPRFHTVADVAERYRMKPGWVTDHASGKRRPLLSGMKTGKRWLFSDAQLLAFENHCMALADQIARRKQPRQQRSAWS
jgi:hypothetical protein